MINAWWFTEAKNFGDELNPYLIEKISGYKANFVDDKKIARHLCVGSIIHEATDNDIVWGSGFINKDHHTSGKPKICAVRGPKTRKKLIKDGIVCPKIYGDPALLLPRYFNPKVEKKYKVGIVPHYVDKHIPWIKKLWNCPEIKLINIQGEIEDVIKDMLSCEMIFSSSLHGLIVGDAYGIPSYWIKFHDRLGDFKYEDYLESVGRDTLPYLVFDETTIDDLVELVTYEYQVFINLDLLYESCPFKPKTNLSILICTIPSRTRPLLRLLYTLEQQANGKPVEILYLGDNKQMSVGEKRNKLLSMASGKYVAFIDDDDRVSDDYVDKILDHIGNNPDVICFDAEISENGSPYKKVKYHIWHECDKNLPTHYERMPNHLMAVKRELALKAGFPGKSFAEDHEYAKRLKPLLKVQKTIDKTLYYYDFNEKTSETRG